MRITHTLSRQFRVQGLGSGLRRTGRTCTARGVGRLIAIPLRQFLSARLWVEQQLARFDATIREIDKSAPDPSSHVTLSFEQPSPEKTAQFQHKRWPQLREGLSRAGSGTLKASHSRLSPASRIRNHEMDIGHIPTVLFQVWLSISPRNHTPARATASSSLVFSSELPPSRYQQAERPAANRQRRKPVTPN